MTTDDDGLTTHVRKNPFFGVAAETPREPAEDGPIPWLIDDGSVSALAPPEPDVNFIRAHAAKLLADMQKAETLKQCADVVWLWVQLVRDNRNELECDADGDTRIKESR